jgi:hypothetical protein
MNHICMWMNRKITAQECDATMLNASTSPCSKSYYSLLNKHELSNEGGAITVKPLTLNYLQQHLRYSMPLQPRQP